MSQYDYDRAKRAAEAGKPLPPKTSDHWKTRQDGCAGHAAGKPKKA